MIILQRNLSAPVRAKLYLILALISLTLFFYSVSQIAYVCSEPSDPLGLISHFTPAYWIGLFLLTICSVYIFLDEEIKSDGLNLFVLLCLGLYLFGIATLVQENVRHATIYTNLADVRNVLITGHTNITGYGAAEFYRLWPAAHITLASILQITGMDFKDLLSFLPWLWLFSFTFITYAIGRRFGLSQNLCFLLSFLALSSYWMLQSDFSQQGYGALLFLMCFMFLVNPNPQRTVGETILPVLCFAALILTHGLTGLALLSGLAVLSIYRIARRQYTPFLFLFSTLWLTWYMYVAFRAFVMGVRNWLGTPWQLIFKMGVHVEGLYDPTYTFASALIVQYSQIAYIFIYGSCIAVAIYLLTRNKIKKDNKKWVLVLLTWIIGIGLTGFIYPNREMYIRLYMLGLVPVISIILKVFSSRRLLISLMLLVLLCSLPARYSTEGHYGQVFSSELAGVRFFTYSAGSVEPWFIYHAGDLGVLPFYNADIILWPKMAVPPPGQERNDTLNEASYVINSNHGGASDRDVKEWMELGGGEEAALIYNNGYFKVYKNR